MEPVAKASLRFLKMSPRKVRVVADLVRGKNAGVAIQTLSLLQRAAAQPVKKLIESAVANARQSNPAIDVDSLVIGRISVDQGPTKHMRRWRPRAMGRATRVVKGVSHVNVELTVR